MDAMWTATESPIDNWNNTETDHTLVAYYSWSTPQLSIPHDDPLDLNPGSASPDYDNFESLWGYEPESIGDDDYLAGFEKTYDESTGKWT